MEQVLRSDMRMEEQVAVLKVQLSVLEERVGNHKDDITETKKDMKSMNIKLTAIIILILVNGGVSALGNWTKLIAVFGV